jgi:hypothetical protein
MESVCGKCGAEMDAPGKPRWCKACRAKYQKEYQLRRAHEERSEGFTEGATAMKAMLLAGVLSAHPAAVLKCAEVANWISRSPLPEFSEAVSDSQSG